MDERLMKFLRWLCLAAVPMSGGAAALLIWHAIMPFGPLIKASGGLVGFFFGMVFVAGMVVVSVLYWIVTGKNIMDMILGM